VRGCDNWREEVGLDDQVYCPATDWHRHTRVSTVEVDPVEVASDR